jgi:hypothetical protein
MGFDDATNTVSGQVTLHPSCCPTTSMPTCSIQRVASGNSVATLTDEDLGTWFASRGTTIISTLYSGVDGSQLSSTRVNMSHQLCICAHMHNKCVVPAEQPL